MEQCLHDFYLGRLHMTSSPSEELKNKYKNSQDFTSHCVSWVCELVYLTRDEKCELLFVCLQR